MSTSSSFWHSAPRVGDVINKWGYSFVWTDNHLAQEDIQPLRQQYDVLGAEALERIQAVRLALLEESKVKGTAPPSNDLYTLLRDHHRDDETLSRFWNELHTVPDWVDWEQIQRGQRFLYRYAIANIIGFALQGFMAENSAASGVVEVLVRTGGFSTRMLLGRLLETFQWLIQATHSLPAIQPGGEGHTATIRVRLLHTSVRQRIMKLYHRKPEYFDTDLHGVPVNTLDSIHSISTFCCNHMWLQLPRFGITPTQHEIDDYIALFRYLGYLLGTPTAHFETSDKAKVAMESFYLHELRITETSCVVAYNFIQCILNLPGPFRVSRGFIEAGSRWINGDELCDELDLGRAGALHRLVFVGYCVLVVVMAWMQRIIPGLDGLIIKLFRAILHRGIVQRKSRTNFHFKYIPHERKITAKEAYHAHKGKDDEEVGYPVVWPRGIYMGLVEVVFLTVIVVSGGVILSGILVGCLQLAGMTGRMGL